MATLSDFTKLNTLVLQFAIQRIRQTPNEAIQGADNGIVEYLEECVSNSGVGEGWLLFTTDARETVNEVMSRWANAATAEHYGTHGDNDSAGWLVLSWGICEMIRNDAGDAAVS